MKNLLANLSLMLRAQLLLPSFLLSILLSILSLVNGNRAIAADLSTIRDRGYLTVAVKNNLPPLGFVDAAGNLDGFEIEIARRLAEELLGDASAVRLVPVQNVDRLNAVLEDRVDIAIADITITEPRRRIINFSYPYYLDGVAFITHNSSVQTLPDLRTATIALLNLSSTVPHVRYSLPGARLIGVASYAEGQQLLAAGEVDAFAGDLSVLTGWQRNDPSAYRLLSSYLSAEPLSIAMPKGAQYSDLQRAINQALQRWYEEGWLQERAAFWGLPAAASQFVNLGAEPAQ
ncbi:MAG: ABC transporter substrate-binding protein [Phormidesmis priestleyi]|uniref:ABC transporter substrate-binding protein n=1 Tax=Phormidesmis priestleyi TaxID=268141 RepID=A0A2W4XLK5_9CYAN|nr:MAG: ABC transporter substrate-binding protein [Phormidesmis priestleyi]